MVLTQKDALVHLLVAEGIVKIRLRVTMVVSQQRRCAAVASDACGNHENAKLGIGPPATKDFSHPVRLRPTLLLRATSYVPEHQ